ncbi:MAG: ogr/Delta-like zinc finger family protein [Methylococcaceae bacterium]|nr:ogr/Delta-like zinc finger family protein [Methylococcaceae bacterium]MDP3021106.1 ogr/Delta-like zinc finger family protein [Methylococcaceae bacterium]
MRVNCPNCSTKAIITGSKELSANVIDLYCQCINTQSCGASFVCALEYKHNTRLPNHAPKPVTTE